jgi:hypothetical protein
MSSQLTPSLAISLVPRSPELLALRRSPQQPRNAPTLPTLPKTNAYIFTKGLIRRTMLDTTPRSVLYNCTQPSCNYLKTMDTTRVVGTGNFIKHYNNQHKDIPTSLANEKQLKQSKKENPEFLRRYSSRTTLADHIRKLVL